MIGWESGAHTDAYSSKLKVHYTESLLYFSFLNIPADSPHDGAFKDTWKLRTEFC